jgi:tetratricopeptide (TPR) repeat protein
MYNYRQSFFILPINIQFVTKLLFTLIFISPLCLAQELTSELIELANREIKQENFPAAHIYIDSAIALSPENPEIYMIRASIYKKESNNRMAIRSYEDAIKANPGYHQAYFERSVLRYEIGDHRDYSLQDINKAISLQSSNTQYLVQKASYLRNTHDSETGLPDLLEAIATLSEAIQLAPDSARFYDLRGQIQFENGQRLSAIADFSKAIEMNPDAVYFGDRGLTYLILEDYQDAINDFTSAVELDPLNEDYIQKRGHAKFNSGKYNDAIEDFTLSINVLFRKISLTSGKVDQNHPFNKSLQENYLFRGSALLQVDAAYEACIDFESARELGSKRAANYIRRFCR